MARKAYTRSCDRKGVRPEPFTEEYYPDSSQDPDEFGFVKIVLRRTGERVALYRYDPPRKRRVRRWDR
jgi:hypothetical protein